MNHDLYNGSKFGVAFKVTIHSPCREVTLSKETAKVQERNGAQKGMVKVKAAKIPEKYAKPIISTDTKLYNYFDDPKRCIKVNGQSIFPPEKVVEVWQDIYGHTDVSSKHVMGGILGERIINIAVLREACQNGELREELNKLGDLADQVEVLSCEDIANKFSVDIFVSADMESPVIRGLFEKMDKDIVAKLETRVKADAEASYNKALTEMSNFTANWIERTLNKLIATCKGDPKGKHFKGLVDDIRELVDEVPKYNLLSDQKTQDVVNKVFATFGTLEKEAFKDEKTRSQAIEDAQKILQEFTGKPCEATVSAFVETSVTNDAAILDSIPS